MPKEDIVVGLDIGTSKIAVIIGNTWQNDPEKIEIIGVGTAPSDGLRKGVVVDIDLTTAAIRQAVEAAELMAVCGNRICLCRDRRRPHQRTNFPRGRCSGWRRTRKLHRRMSTAPLERLKPFPFRLNAKFSTLFLKVTPLTIRRVSKTLSGCRVSAFEVYVHIVTGAVAAAQNLLNSVFKAGLSVENIVLEPIASAESVLTHDEREAGVVLADMGSGTTDVVIYKEDALHHTAVLSIGGEHVTNDIAQVLRITPQEADRLKLHKGSASMDLVDLNDTIQISTVGGARRPRFHHRRDLVQIIQCRMEEVLTLIGNEINRSKIRTPAGVVLTGGTSLLDGLVELSEKSFPCPVRVGYPHTAKGINGPRS